MCKKKNLETYKVKNMYYGQYNKLKNRHTDKMQSIIIGYYACVIGEGKMIKLLPKNNKEFQKDNFWEIREQLVAERWLKE